jgi:hypothetical protein
MMKLKQETLQTQADTLIRDRILTNKKLMDKTFLELGDDLSAVSKNSVYRMWGYPHFKAYIDQELQFSKRQAYYLIEIWDLVEGLDLDKEKVEEIGWTKMTLILKVMTVENADIWLEKAQNLSWSKLEAEVKAALGVDTKSKLVKLTFHLEAGDAAIITEALEESKRIHETDSDGLALLQICGDWTILRQNSPDKITVKDYILYVQKAFGVKLLAPFEEVVEHPKDKEDVEDFNPEEDDDDVDALLEL